MDLAAHRAAVPHPLRQTTLVFLRDGGRILLAMKKRGFGAGRYNGAGGKLEAGETVEQAAIRETKEEIDVTPSGLRQIAILDFYFPLKGAESGWDQQVVAYEAKAWEGDPRESEEMKPEWFIETDLPFSSMWPDDPLWLPKALAGEPVRMEFFFGEGDSVLEYNDL